MKTLSATENIIASPSPGAVVNLAVLPDNDSADELPATVAVTLAVDAGVNDRVNAVVEPSPVCVGSMWVCFILDIV